MNNAIIKFRNAPVTVEEAKYNIFAPIVKIPEIHKNNYLINEEVFNSDSFRVCISGIRLTQIHRDILDIALFCGDYKLEEEIEENIPIRTFSLYTIQKHLQCKYKNNNKWLIHKFEELQRAMITVEDKKKNDTYKFNIIRASKHSKKLNTFVLVFEEIYLNFFESRISINYKELLEDILKLKYPQTKAVVRYLLSYTDGHNINIDKLLQKIGVQGGQRNFEIVRKNVLDELTRKGNKFNIELIINNKNTKNKKDTTLVYTRHKEVKVYFPQQTYF